MGSALRGVVGRSKRFTIGAPAAILPLPRHLPLRHGARSARAHCAICSAATPGHLFIVHGDLRLILADDVFYPTRTFSHPVWFAEGPPEGARPIEPWHFTTTARVHPVDGLTAGQPRIWLGWVSWEGLGSAPVEWFLDAAEQFLEQAAARSLLSGESGVGGRPLPLLALPVIGTGGTGGKGISGELLTELLKLLMAFVAERPVDVVLVAKSRQMLSAAQSVRRGFEPASVQSLLGPRLRDTARRLAR